MEGINPADIPGYTQMYTFGVKASKGQYIKEYLVITVRAPSEEAAKRHIESIFRGNYSSTSLQFFTDMEAWKQEAKTSSIKD